MLLFGLCSTSDVGQTGQWTWTPSTTPLQPIKWNASFWIMFTSDDQPGWSMDSNPMLHPSPANKMKCSFLIMFNFWWSAGLVNGLKPHSPPLSSQKNEMLIFWLCSTSDDQPGWSMDLNPICQPSPANKMKCFFLDCVHFWWSAGWLMDSNPICHLSPAIKMKCSFLYYIQLLMLARLVDDLKPHPPPISSQ